MSKTFLEVSGHCVCGRISYVSQQSGPVLPIFYCHCKDCQESHSSPYTSVFMSKETTTKWKNFQELSSFNRRGKNERLFCQTCHVQMASWLNKGTKKAMFGLFQSSIEHCPLKQQPIMHIFTSEATVDIPDDGLKRRP